MQSRVADGYKTSAVWDLEASSNTVDCMVIRPASLRFLYVGLCKTFVFSVRIKSLPHRKERTKEAFAAVTTES